MAVKKEIIQFNVSNLTDCNFGVRLFDSQAATINATTKYGWTLSDGFEVFTNDDENVYGNLTSCAGPNNYSCGSWTIVINGTTYTIAFNGTIDGAVQALTALGFGLFCYQSVTITTTTTSTSTTAAPTTTTTTTSAPTTSTTTTSTTAAPTTTTTTTSAPTTSTTTTSTTAAPTTTTTTTSAPTTSTTTTSTTAAPTTTSTTTSTTTFVAPANFDNFDVSIDGVGTGICSSPVGVLLYYNGVFGTGTTVYTNNTNPLIPLDVSYLRIRLPSAGTTYYGVATGVVGASQGNC